MRDVQALQHAAIIVMLWAKEDLVKKEQIALRDLISIPLFWKSRSKRLQVHTTRLVEILFLSP